MIYSTKKTWISPSTIHKQFVLLLRDIVRSQVPDWSYTVPKKGTYNFLGYWSRDYQPIVSLDSGLFCGLSEVTHCVETQPKKKKTPLSSAKAVEDKKLG
jgi:hypothetical protein